MAIKRKGRRPLCDCHHLPMRKHGRNPKDRRKFTYSCSVVRCRIVQKYRDKAVAEGLCSSCCKNPAVHSYVCEQCRQDNLLRNCKKTYAKYTRLIKLDMDDPEYFEIVTGGRIA